MAAALHPPVLPFSKSCRLSLMKNKVKSPRNGGIGVIEDMPEG